MSSSMFRQQKYNLVLGFSFLILVMASSVTTAYNMRDRYEEWITKYDVVFKDTSEKEKRFEIFKTNVEYIDSSNAAGDKPYKLGVNAFAHLTRDEMSNSGRVVVPNFAANRNSTRASGSSFNITQGDVPETLDWRERGAVTEVKNQGPCGACWAFAAVGTIEGINQIITGELISLSEQQLLDCTEVGNSGCKGGHIDQGIGYAVDNQGITTEASYPYQASRGTCRHDVPLVAKPFDYATFSSEPELLNAVLKQPTAVGVNIDGDFQLYSGGVFTGPCGSMVNHALTVVGYGTTPDGMKYWLCKNSYGPEWGEQGYIRLQRDVAAPEGMCGIALIGAFAMM